MNGESCTPNRIGDFCQVGDGAHASIKRVDCGVLYLMARNLKNGRLNLDKVSHITEESFDRHFRETARSVTRVHTGDVIFGIIGSIGDAYVVRDSDQFGLSSSVAILRPDNNRVLPRYLYYWVLGETFQDALMGIKGGVAQGYVSLEMMRSLPLEVPPLPLQRRIASILSTYDDLIENNTRRIAVLEEMARRLYEEWFVHFRFPGHEEATFTETEHGRVSEGWEESTIGQVFGVVLGGTPSRKKPEYWVAGDVPWIASGKVNELRILSPSEYITDEALRRSAAKMMPAGTTVLAITGATLGQVSSLLEPMCANQSVVGIIDESGRFQEYVYRQVCHRITQIINHASGGAQQHINKEIVKSAPYLVPDEKVLDAYNSLAVPIGRQVGTFLRKNANLRTQRDLLLPKLVSGEIDVSEAENSLEATAA